MKRSRIVLLVIVLLAAAGTGMFFFLEGNRTCEGVTGTILRDGKPLAWTSDQGFLLVLLIPSDEKLDPIRAETDRATGTFKLPSLPSGKYRLAIQQFDERHNDALGHSYDPSATELTCDVLESNQVLRIDLPRDLPPSKRVTRNVPMMNNRPPRRVSRPKEDLNDTPKENKELNDTPKENPKTIEEED